MAIPPFDQPREHHSHLGRLLAGGAGWLIAGAAIGALIVVLVMNASVPWSVLRRHLPHVTWEHPAGPKQAAQPRQEAGKAKSLDAAPEANKAQTPVRPATPPQAQRENSGHADTRPAIPPAAAPAPSSADATGVASAQPTPAAKFEAASVTKRVVPSYPRLARENRIEGQVLVKATVGTDGRVRKVEIVEGNPILGKAAADAMRQWRYEPARLDGVPVASVVMTAMRFVFAA